MNPDLINDPSAQAAGGERPGLLGRTRLLAGLLALALLAAYSNHFTNPFQFDDIYSLRDNGAIRSLRNPGRFFADARTLTIEGRNSQYRPLAALSFAADYAWGGGDPRVFHVSSFMWHLFASWLCWRLLYRLLDPSAADPVAERWALLAAGIFALHPIATEPLNHLTLRSELMAAAAIFAVPLCWLAAPRWRRTGWWLLPMAAGALAKPTALVAAPLLASVIWLIPEPHRPNRRTALAAIAGVSLAAAALFTFTHRMDGIDAIYGPWGRWEYLRTEVFVWLDYLRLALLPIGLTPDRSVVPVLHWWDTRVVLGAAASAAVICAGWNLWRRRAPEGPAAMLGSLWFFFALIPSSSIFPLAINEFEYRLYPALPGLLLLVSALAKNEARKRQFPDRWVVAAACVVMLLFGVLTHLRNRDWGSAVRLWEQAAKVTPESPLSWSSLGYAYQETGRTDLAAAAMRRAVELNPEFSNAQLNLAIYEAEHGDPASARTRVAEVLRREPRSGPALAALAYVELRSGHPDAYARELLGALRVNPGDLPNRTRLLALLRDEPTLASTRCGTLAELADFSPGDDLALLRKAWCSASGSIAPAPPATAPPGSSGSAAAGSR